jgi:hypothetical protein
MSSPTLISNFEIKFVLNNGETNSPSVAHVGYDISPLKRVKFKILTTSRIVTHGQLKENLYL